MSALLLTKDYYGDSQNEIVTPNWSATSGNEYGSDPNTTMLGYESVGGKGSVILQVPLRAFAAHALACQNSGKLIDLTDIAALEKKILNPTSPAASFQKKAPARKPSGPPSAP